MNKYRDKSDFEINKVVAEYYLTRAYRFNSADEVVELMDIDLSCEFGGKINRVDTQAVGTFDPCNNPSDAYPIIFENKININFRESIKTGVMAELSGWSEVYSINENPLRAAMEVFLMMKEAENEKI